MLGNADARAVREGAGLAEAMRRPTVRDNTVGLDTGRVYRGRLTAFEAATGRIVQVSARKTYRRRRKDDYYDLGG